MILVTFTIDTTIPIHKEPMRTTHNPPLASITTPKLNATRRVKNPMINNEPAYSIKITKNATHTGIPICSVK